MMRTTVVESRCPNSAAARSRGFKPEVKVICGEHRAFVDPCDGQHPMYTAPVPSLTEDDPTVAYLPIIKDGQQAA